jgi:hypothetical protein
MQSSSIIGGAFGGAHRRWMLSPKKAALIGLGYYLVVVIASGSLHIWSKFTYKSSSNCLAVVQTIDAGGAWSNAALRVSSDPALADGFAIWNWGILYSFSLPLAAFLMAYYFRTLDQALLSLDDVIKPAGSSKKPFTEFLTERVRAQWSSTIFPISFALAVILTLVADGHDIVAPLQSSVIWPTCTRDWSTVGYTQGFFAPIWYFVFNCAAFSMQAFLAFFLSGGS